MVNYANAKIYKLENDWNDEFFIGSTCDALSKKFYEHKRRKTSNGWLRLHLMMHKVGEIYFKITLLEKYPCKDADELTAREMHWRRELNPSLNYVHSQRDWPKEYVRTKFEVNQTDLIDRCYEEEEKRLKDKYEEVKERNRLKRIHAEKLRAEVKTANVMFRITRWLEIHRQNTITNDQIKV